MNKGNIPFRQLFSFEKLAVICLACRLLWCRVYFSMTSCFLIQTMRYFYHQISVYHSLSTQIFKPSAGSGDAKTPDNFARYAIIIWTIILTIPPLLHSTAKLVKIYIVGDFNFQFAQIFLKIRPTYNHLWRLQYCKNQKCLLENKNQCPFRNYFNS